MKRSIAIALALSLLICFLPINAHAEENSSGYAILLEKACSAFPEFEEKLTNPVLPISTQSRSTPELVYSETRALSEEEYITYSEYSDGIILLADFDMEWSKRTHETSPISSGYIYDVTITASCVGIGHLTIHNMKYAIVLGYGSYDYIIDTGTASPSERCTIAETFPTRMAENVSECATLKYGLYFQAGPTGYYTMESVLRVLVGRDTINIYHDRIY